jgi:hypothetical protein
VPINRNTIGALVVAPYLRDSNAPSQHAVILVAVAACDDQSSVQAAIKFRDEAERCLLDVFMMPN